MSVDVACRKIQALVHRGTWLDHHISTRRWSCPVAVRHPNESNDLDLVVFFDTEPWIWTEMFLIRFRVDGRCREANATETLHQAAQSAS